MMASFDGHLEVLQYLFDTFAVDLLAGDTVRQSTPCKNMWFAALPLTPHLLLPQKTLWTPLMCAARYGRLHVMQWLVDKHGARLGESDNVCARLSLKIYSQNMSALR